ncbi:MAG: sulfatase-like hydrolase/transferase [Planctomycetota bacterium]
MLAAAGLVLAAAQSPVLVVDIDDVGSELAREARTETLDWIAENGRVFTSFVASPVCSPSRAMFQTGAYPSHPDLLLGQVVTVDAEYEMPTGPLVPLGTLVSDAGLRTAKIGKWHLAPGSAIDHPARCGWQRYVGVPGNVFGEGNGYTSYEKVTGGEAARVEGRYLTTDETDDAIAAVREGFDLVSVSYHAPHKPYHVPPEGLHGVEPIESFRDHARAMLEACDRELGRLVRAALERDYVVLVFSDNGTGRLAKGQKGTMLDGGIVVPMWAIGPGVAPGVDASPVSVVDLYATIAELLGVETGGPTRGPHSISFARTLAGERGTRRFTYSETFRGLGEDPRTSGKPWNRALRGTRFKLEIRGKASKRKMLLFDLQADPTERTNLISAASLARACRGLVARCGRSR